MSTSFDQPDLIEAEFRARIAAANKGGDYLRALDLAAQGLESHPTSIPLAYDRLLALARVGATQRAEAALDRLEAERPVASLDDPALRIDFLALRGRLLKDRAMRAASAAERGVWAQRAALVYQRVHEDWGGCFAAVNAATLWRVAGEPEKAAAIARRALDSAPAETDPYWRAASEGEAWIHLGDEDAAATALHVAAEAAAGRLEAIASTRRQLDWLARSTGVGRTALAALPSPRVFHWRADPPAAADAQADSLEALAPAAAGSLAFGSLFSSADIIVAEALLRDGAELNLALPCESEVCAAFIVDREGVRWLARFHALLQAARNVTVVTPEGDPGDPTLVRLTFEQAVGQALLRAAALATTAYSLTISPQRREFQALNGGADASKAAIANWPSLGGGDPIWSRRRVRALVFGDIKGFSTISEARHPAFFDAVLGGFADALAPLGDKVEYAETAGDGLYVVLSDVVSAVRACHALQRSVDPGRFAAAGLPPGLGLRLSAHVGPVFPGLDRVTGREKFFGKEVVRTARIEPVTPPGETYVTEQFAACLAFAARDSFACEYVGLQPMAKGFGACRMYSLREVAAAV